MALILHSRWNKQPICPAVIDWSNPLARGLVDAVTPFSPQTYITVNRYSSFGVAGRLYKTLTVTQSNRLINQGTVFGLLNYTGITFTSYDRILYLGQGTNYYADVDEVWFGTENSTTEGGIIRKNNIAYNSLGRTVKTSGTIPTLVTYPTGTGLGALYERGIYQVDITSAGTRPFSTGKQRNLDTKSAYMMAVWDRQLTPREIVEVSANPWQLFLKQTVAVPTYYPILSNLQATRGNTSASLRTNITY